MGFGFWNFAYWRFLLNTWYFLLWNFILYTWYLGIWTCKAGGKSQSVEWSNGQKKEHSDLTNCKNVKRSNGQMVEWSKKRTLWSYNWDLDFGTLHIGDFSLILGTFYFETFSFILGTLYFKTLYFILGTLDFKTTYEHTHFHDQQLLFNDICRLF